MISSGSSRGEGTAFELAGNIARLLALLALTPFPILSQSPAVTQQLANTQSIGDAVQIADRARAGSATSSAPPIHILYMHGINQVGPGDSVLLRKGICKYLGECKVTKLSRIYAGGPFAVDSAPPALAYLQAPIWKTKDDWNASAPFIDRYEITGNGHVTILLDELNWWPLAYPVKCKSLIANDATLTGPSKDQLAICEMPECTSPQACRDNDTPGRFLRYQWISPAQAAQLNHISRHATFANRSLKNGLMDWGFSDAVMALGPLGEVLCAGIRELLIKSLQSSGVDLGTAKSADPGPDFFFVTHSLGSFLAIAALDSDWLGPQSAEVAQFKITAEERNAADYFSVHTAGFYFLANQIALLELARVSAVAQPCVDACASPPAGTSLSSGKSAPLSIAHWQCKRQFYLKQGSLTTHGPQIIAWNDPNDLLSWNVPEIAGVRVVNIPVRNAAFKLPPFFGWPPGAHANYADNAKVLRLIFKPSAKP